MIRINKYLAQCGVASRRAADDLIQQGRVSVNGEVVEKPGLMVDEQKDAVAVDGRPVSQDTAKTYILLNKPSGIISSVTDPQGRKTVISLLKKVEARVYPVGRLDLDTEGLLLLTNDGELAHRLTHPRYQVEKVYDAIVSGQFTRSDAQQIKQGIKLEDGATGRARVDILQQRPKSTDIRLTLTEGRKREVKQLCAAVGHPVKHLKRIAFGTIIDPELPVGQWRELTSDEVRSLAELVSLK